MRTIPGYCLICYPTFVRSNNDRILNNQLRVTAETSWERTLLIEQEMFGTYGPQEMCHSVVGRAVL